MIKDEIDDYAWAYRLAPEGAGVQFETSMCRFTLKHPYQTPLSGLCAISLSAPFYFTVDD
jgi:hypothetical protein